MGRDMYAISGAELGRDAKVPVAKLGDAGEVFYEMALDMLEGVRANNREGRRTVYIVPVGPVGQFHVFARMANRERLDLKNCWFINMDEYLDSDGRFIDKGHRLSFRGFMEREVYSRIDPELIMPPEQRVFPDPDDLERVPALVEKLGGVDIAFGGVGIHGHLAFNEARPELDVKAFAQLRTRTLDIATETVVANAIGELGGALELMPRKAVTVGMWEILQARKVRLGLVRPWQHAVVRRVAYGDVSAGFPASLLQNHPDALMYACSVVAG